LVPHGYMTPAIRLHCRSAFPNSRPVGCCRKKPSCKISGTADSWVKPFGRCL
jgi:hypothetical protein